MERRAARHPRRGRRARHHHRHRPGSLRPGSGQPRTSRVPRRGRRHRRRGPRRAGQRTLRQGNRHHRQPRHPARVVRPTQGRRAARRAAALAGPDPVRRARPRRGRHPALGQHVPVRLRPDDRTGLGTSTALDSGDLVHLYWDADQDISPGLLSGVLDGPKTRIDSGTTVGPMEPLDSIWVRATATDPAVCRISAESAAVTNGLCTPVVRSRTLALAEGDSIAYLAVQRLQAPKPSFRTGAIGHGPNGASLAERLCRHIDTWGADRAAKPRITIYPPDSAPHTAGAQVITREHCEMTVVY